MKRFLLFAGSTYYPSGGWNDYLGDFDSTEAAKDFLLSRSTSYSSFDWWHILDTSNRTVVHNPTKS